MKIPTLAKSKGWVEALVKERKGSHERKLEVSRLRETLVLEEFDVNVEDVYDFRCDPIVFVMIRWRIPIDT